MPLDGILLSNQKSGCLLCYLFICMHVLALRFLILQYVSCMLTTSLGQKESE